MIIFKESEIQIATINGKALVELAEKNGAQGILTLE